MMRLWLAGLLRARAGRLAAAAAGVAMTVALLTLLGAFLSQSVASMTRRAAAGVVVDWQVQLLPGLAPAALEQAARQAAPVAGLAPVGYADVAGFSSRTGATVQTTGAGQVVGIGPDYAARFARQFRYLLGSRQGVLLAQQTAANLHAGVGDRVSILRSGQPAVTVRVDGVVDLPDADAMFQAIGVPAGSAPQAPPDNVLILPLDSWHRLFDRQAAAQPASVRLQLHVALQHATLPPQPQDAYVQARGELHKLEARVAGQALVADNLGTRLDGVRSDALYAKVLFLFLGAPGVTLAALLSIAVVQSGAERRRRDQALLRLRGASLRQVLQLTAVEAAGIGVLGSLAGLALALAGGRALLETRIAQSALLGWGAGAAGAGLLLCLAAMLWRAWQDMRQTTVAGARLAVGALAPGLWRRLGLDWLCLLLAGLIDWRTAASGYQVVLAPEGMPVASVDYAAFLAPLLFWLGAVLLVVRMSLIGFERGRALLTRLLLPLAGKLAGTVAAAMSRQRRRMTRGIALVALAFAFATSTAVFNTTYQAQAQVDAELSNGADVTVTGHGAAPASARLPALAALPGVLAAEPMQHRLAYVGADLQDLYGIDPLRIGRATRMSNAYFQGGAAEAVLRRLAATPDGVLVSEETVKDFQLQPGDTLNLRLQNAQDRQYHVVPFRFVGVVREFPTAPRDSFLVANAGYIARMTGSPAAEIVLLKTTAPPGQVAASVRRAVAGLAGVTVSDLGQAQRLIASSLTAVDLGGLTRLELVFALLMVAGATGLILALGAADRKRTFAILSALGARPRQLGAFLWGEAAVLFGAGAAAGSLIGFALAWMLVKLLTDVFDPPPQTLAVPWLYLAALAAMGLSSLGLALLAALREARVPAVQRMREL